MSKEMSKEKLKTILANLNIEVTEDGKVDKKQVQAALDKIKDKAEVKAEADTAESGHKTEEYHNSALEAIGEWRAYAESYDQPENAMAKEACLKALDCAAHCLSMAADFCNMLAHDEEGGEEMVEGPEMAPEAIEEMGEEPMEEPAAE